MANEAGLTIVAVGDNPTPIWGMLSRERIRRIADKMGMRSGAADGACLLVDTGFAFDPLVLRHLAGTPGARLVKDGRIVIAHARDASEAATLKSAMEGRDAPPPEGEVIVAGPDFTLYNSELRKREQPLVMALIPANVRAIERATYFGAYKGVTDILTKYLWPEWALVLTRIAARIGATPNMVTAVGAVLCVASFFLFWHGHYWLGMASGLIFMVLDTVDGKLARCTITSSWWGNIFDHGIDLVHPPFWWWAWAEGLGTWGLALSPGRFAFVMLAVTVGYVVQRLIEGAFMRLYGMHIHVWERADSQFRLITARRNPNMVILFAATLFARPDLGIEAVAWWTILSCVFHAVRLVQAMIAKGRGAEIRSWLG